MREMHERMDVPHDLNAWTSPMTSALPGHLARVELYPLSLAEIKANSFNLIDYLAEGGFKSEFRGHLT